jgi:hypothetical protein
METNAMRQLSHFQSLVIQTKLEKVAGGVKRIADASQTTEKACGKGISVVASQNNLKKTLPVAFALPLNGSG